jgi:hypothetical protein
MSDSDGTGDPLSPLMIGATALHENLVSMVEAGFTRDEGMRIVLTMLTEAIQAANRAGGVGSGSGLCRLPARSASRD